MKKVTNIILATFILSILLMVGCKKDNDSPNNKMNYDGTEYELSQGFLENFGKWTDQMDYNMEIVLLSSGFAVHEADGEIDSLSGIGHGIIFDLFTASSNKVDVGEYTYDSNDSGQAGTFNFADGVVNYNSATEDGTEFEISAGKLTIVQNGDTYELNFDCTAENGKQVTGYFKGSLKYYDMSDTKSLKTGFKKHQLR